MRLIFLICFSIAFGASCSRYKVENTAKEIDALLIVGLGKTDVYPSDYVAAYIDNKSILEHASGEWLVRALDVAGSPWPENQADIALLSVLNTKHKYSMEAYERSMEEAVLSNRLGAVILLVNESEIYYADNFLNEQQQRAKARGNVVMSLFLQKAMSTNKQPE